MFGFYKQVGICFLEEFTVVLVNVQSVLHFAFGFSKRTDQSSIHPAIWLSGGWRALPHILGEICPYMGLTERGRVAIASPVVLQPAPVVTISLRSFALIFISGFFTAVCWIVWLLWD